MFADTYQTCRSFVFALFMYLTEHTEGRFDKVLKLKGISII